MATVNVNINDPMSFDPPSVTVNAGDTVQWTWTGSVQHSTTADDGSWDSGVHPQSGDPAPGFVYSHTFPSSGSNPYYCVIHGAPGGIGMSGTVEVN